MWQSMILPLPIPKNQTSVQSHTTIYSLKRQTKAYHWKSKINWVEIFSFNISFHSKHPSMSLSLTVWKFRNFITGTICPILPIIVSITHIFLSKMAEAYFEVPKLKKDFDFSSFLWMSTDWLQTVPKIPTVKEFPFIF